MSGSPIAVCFVCLGNICRSPTALGVMRAAVARRGLVAHFELDSAGTGAYHAGELPDGRARAAALRRGVALEHRARQVTAADFTRFDYLLAMDRDNLENLLRFQAGAFEAPAPRRIGERVAGARAEVLLLRSFDADAEPLAEVPDPYYGGEAGFELVLDMCERACEGLIDAALARRRA